MGLKDATHMISSKPVEPPGSSGPAARRTGAPWQDERRVADGRRRPGADAGAAWTRHRAHRYACGSDRSV